MIKRKQEQSASRLKNIGGIIFKILASTIIVIGIMISIRQSHIVNQLKMHQALEIFVKIDDIAHQEINEEAEENPFDGAGKKMFHEIDKEYHRTNNIQKKYAATKRMIHLLDNMEKNRPIAIGEKDTDPERDKEYRELLRQFEELE